MFGITFVLLFFIAYDESNGQYFVDENQMKDCFFHLLCELNYTEEFQEAAEKVGPKYVAEGLGWGEQVLGTDLPNENSVETWIKASIIMCPYSKAERNRLFDEVGQLAGEYWLKACINTFSPECKEVQTAIEILAEKFREYNQNGDCAAEKKTS